jgi:hypothetical protein
MKTFESEFASHYTMSYAGVSFDKCKWGNAKYLNARETFGRSRDTNTRSCSCVLPRVKHRLNWNLCRTRLGKPEIGDKSGNQFKCTYSVIDT